ncbi:hypothetical protein HQ560_22245 [bacterium]|nr:hypothetical protein [bacterium]
MRVDVYSPRRYLLLDACTVAGYYLPENTGNKGMRARARERIISIVDAVREKYVDDVVLFLPIICVTEVHGIFARRRFSGEKDAATENISHGTYEDVSSRFQEDVESNSPYVIVEVSGEHIRLSKLVNVFDAKVPRLHSKGRMGSADRVILAMGAQLADLHGRDNVAVVSADGRMNQILTDVSVRMASEHVLPHKLDLLKDEDSALEAFFDIWPLPSRPCDRLPLGKWYGECYDLLDDFVENSSASPDSIPYTKKFEKLYRKVRGQTGYAVSRSDVFQRLLNTRKDKRGRDKRARERRGSRG